MKKMISMFAKNAVIILVATTAVCVVGCKAKNTSENQGNSEAENAADQESPINEAFFSEEIRSLSDAELTALGTPNDFPMQFIFPNALNAKVIFPTRFLQYENASEAIRFFGNSPNLIPYWNQFEKIDLMMTSDKISFVSLLDPKEDKIIGEHYPIPSRATYLKKNAPLNKESLTRSLLSQYPPEKITETQLGNVTVTLGKQTMIVPIDETGKNTARIENVATAVYFPTDDSFVHIFGPQKDIEEFFTLSDGDKRGILAQRMGRIDCKNFDFGFFYDYQSPQKQAIMIPVNEELGTALFKDAKFLSFTINASAAEGESALTLQAETETPEGAQEVEDAVGSALLQLGDQAKAMNVLPEGENAMEEAKSFLANLGNILKTVTPSRTENQLAVTVKKSSELDSFFKNLISLVNQFAEEQAKNAKRGQTAQQIRGLGQFIQNVYYPKNNAFPPMAITASDGTPLLSWRVALLPLMGPEGEALYNEFKLDQPWDGPDNIKLLERIPAIYRSPFSTVETGKTTFQIFSGPDTPFSKSTEGLKMQDFENPGKTFMIVSVVPEKAIEWTRPDTLTYSEESLPEIFGDFVIAAPVMGEVFTAPFAGAEDEIKALTNWIYGKVDETEESEEAAPETPAENPLDEEFPQP